MLLLHQHIGQRLHPRHPQQVTPRATDMHHIDHVTTTVLNTHAPYHTIQDEATNYRFSIVAGPMYMEKEPTLIAYGCGNYVNENAAEIPC